jgi:aspartate racemase
LSGTQPLELPTDHPRQGTSQHRGAAASFGITEEITEKLKQLGRREGSTLFMALLAAFGVVMGRAVGQDDFLIGTDVAGRNHAATEKLIGFFVNQLVLRVDLSGNPTFRELLQRIRQTTLDAYARQDVPFEKLVDQISPERTLARSPLFQVKLVLQNTPRESLSIPGLTVRPLDIQDKTAKFDMLINMRDTSSGIAASNQYDADLFDAATVSSLMGLYAAALKFLASEPKALELTLDQFIRGTEELALRLAQETIGTAFRKRSAAAKPLGTHA